MLWLEYEFTAYTVSKEHVPGKYAERMYNKHYVDPPGIVSYHKKRELIFV